MLQGRAQPRPAAEARILKGVTSVELCAGCNQAALRPDSTHCCHLCSAGANKKKAAADFDDEMVDAAS
jgi:hypothetical protein